MPVQPDERVAVLRAELVDEDARAAEEHVAHALDPLERVVEVVGRRDELMLADVQLLALWRCSGTICPGESREKAIVPLPFVFVMKKSRPAILRLMPPGSLRSSISSGVVFQSSTWCSNMTCCSPISICSCGTSSPRT